METKSDPINFVDSKSESKGDFKSDSKSSSSGGSATTFKADDASANANDAKSIDGRQWWRVARAGLPSEGSRLHTSINGRFITVFRHAGTLSSIDAVCHHAGGPLTLGPIQDIEDLGMTVVLCPWHKFMVSIRDGTKAYQKVEIVGGKPTNVGWVKGKMVQRAHLVREDAKGVYVSLIVDSDVECSSDQDACNALCMQGYDMHEAAVLSS